MTDHPKKLIEVALPLDEINAACKAYKDRKVGTIRNIHKWFAPMPLPAWRALLYAALIDDPDDDEKRAYHLGLIKRLVKNGSDLPEGVDIQEARENICRQFPDGLPTVMDPFSGGGSTLVEGQRLGLPTYGSDLNPVPVLITRTLTELLPRVYGQQPLHPELAAAASSATRSRRPAKNPEQDALLSDALQSAAYGGYEGLIRDITYYAAQVRSQAWEQLQDLYPSDLDETPVAWLWARTATCPNPACGIETVLATSWWISKKPGDLAWIEPSVIDGKVLLAVVSGRSSGEAPPPPKSARGATFTCVGCGNALTDQDLDRQAASPDGLGLRMTATVSERRGQRVYREPSAGEMAAAAKATRPDFASLGHVPASDGGSRNRFGLVTQADLYTDRQLRALTVFSDLVAGVHQQVLKDGGSREWADAIATLLGLTVGKLAQAASSQVRWNMAVTGSPKAEPAFGRNDLPMLWDFAETNPFGDSVGSFVGIAVDQLRSFNFVPGVGQGESHLGDARHAQLTSPGLVATDPPYFDAIGYADLSDYFYMWHRRTLRSIHPDLYATVAAPKQGELTAMPAHHGNSREAARKYFIEGFTQTFTNLQSSMADGLPMIVVYASKEQKAGSGEETRWAAILTAMIQADLEITGTWPIHGTTRARMIGIGANSVASYVVMVCRPRRSGAGVCSLADFNRALRRDLKPAVEELQAAGILPVDMAQAALGPGMQVYSRFRAVVDQSGAQVSVDQALRLINQALTEVLDEQGGELDPYSRFAVILWEKHHWSPAPFGEADQVARPQGISVDDVVRAHVASFPRAGFVTLLGRRDLDREWSSIADVRPTAWEAVHHLADRLIDGGGLSEAGALMAGLGVWRDQAQALVYRLHAIAARKGWTEDQERYNALIGSWSDLLAEAGRIHDNGDGLF